jgi:hypothetical protein
MSQKHPLLSKGSLEHTSTEKKICAQQLEAAFSNLSAMVHYEAACQGQQLRTTNIGTD